MPHLHLQTMQGKRVIAKARHAKPLHPTKPVTHLRKLPDLLCALPADVAACIIDRLREDDLHRIPLVSKAWASLFAPHSPLEPALRALVTRRFGLRSRPPHAAHLSWGQLYLALRKERCHLCPAADVAPFVYAGSSSLALMLHCEVAQSGLALFPVCKRCFGRMLELPGDSFVPVVHSSALGFLSPELAKCDVLVETGFLYSDIPAFTHGRNTDLDKGLQYVLAHPLVERSTRFRLRFLSSPSQDKPSVVLE